jgi:hypothetical protein
MGKVILDLAMSLDGYMLECTRVIESVGVKHLQYRVIK